MSRNQPFEKNYFFAIALSALVLFVYFSLVKPPAPAQTQAQPQTAEQAGAPSGSAAQKVEPDQDIGSFSAKTTEVSPASPAQTFKLESDALTVEFSDRGATLTQLDFKGEPGREHLTQTVFYQGDIEVPGILGVAIRGQAEHLTHSVFKLENKTHNTATYVYEEAGAFRLRKTFQLLDNSPAIQMSAEIENISGREKTYPLELSYAADYHHFGGHPKPGDYFDAMAFTNGLKTAGASKIEKKGFWVSEPAAWTALVKTYFALIVRPDQKIISTRAEAHDGKVVMVNQLEPVTVPAGGKTTVQFKIYSGPQRYETLKNFEDGFQTVLSRGFFGAPKVWLLLILKFLHQFTHNFGWDIVILTLLIKLFFSPLTWISSKSMKKMQLLSPRQKAIQEKYKKDPQRAQREIMELYKRNKVNPISGCLPMLVQLPILIGMFRLLPEAIELHGAPFIFWMQDLSAPDHFMQLPFKIPFLGDWLNLLPFLMVASQVGYQKLMPQAVSMPEQKMIMNIMPFFFGFICWSFPSGLVLYWIFQNLFSMFQQVFINRIQTELHPEDRE